VEQVDGLGVEVSNVAGAVVVFVSGEIDLATAPVLIAALDQLDANMPTVVECSEVQFMDSTGLNVLIEQMMRFDAGGGSLAVRNPSASVRHLLDVSGLDELNESV
jgi:anti-anti-sigma factor